jgi:hypothetical protein
MDMPKISPIKTVKEIEARKGCKTAFSVGGGLGLLCDYSGPRPSFFLRYRADGAYRFIYYKAGISLKDAIALARSDRAKLTQGTDPKEDRRKAKEEQEKAKKDAEEKALKAAYTLERLKRDFIIHKRQNNGYQHNTNGEKNDEYLYGKLTALKDTPVSEITENQLAEIINGLYLSIPVAAKKVKQLLHNMFEYAAARPELTGLTVSPVNDKFKSLIKVAKKNARGSDNDPALPFKEIPDLMRYALEDLKGRYYGPTMFLILSILMAGRAKSIRNSKWQDYDLEAGTYVCPEGLIKLNDEQWKKPPTKEDRTIYLSTQVIELLKSIPRISGCDFVFPNSNFNSHIGTTNVQRSIKRLNGKRILAEGKGFLDPDRLDKNGKPRVITQHGTARAGFTTWALDDELGNLDRFNHMVIEKCMFHNVDPKYNGAYNRAKMEKARREIMQAWSNFCLQGIELPKGITLRKKGK